jgi:hypothetical protein
MRVLRLRNTVVLLLALLPTLAVAQSATGTIAGVVVGAFGVKMNF